MLPYGHYLFQKTKQAAEPWFEGANIDNMQGLRSLIGAGGGGLLGAGLGTGIGLLHESFFGNPDNTHYLTKAIRGAGLGGLAGAGIGGLLGATNAAKRMQFDLEDSANDWLTSKMRDAQYNIADVVNKTQFSFNPISGKMQVVVPKDPIAARPEFNKE